MHSLLISLALFAAAGEVLDRIAVIVGRRVITLSEIVREIRVSALQDGRPVEITPATKLETADRLVERALIQREIRMNRFEQAEVVEANKMLEQFKAKFASEEAWQRELTKYGVSEEDVRTHMQFQLTLVRFVDFRFQPATQIGQPEVERYYQQVFLPAARKKNGAAPALEDVRPEIEQVLREEAANRSLDEWLKQARQQVTIEFHDGAFQ
jgi:hypothetical protein